MVKELVKISEKRRSTGESRAGGGFQRKTIIDLQFVTGKINLPFEI